MSELEYRRIPTTAEVYRAIVSNHAKGFSFGELGVFSSYTNIVENGICTIFTEWGFKDCDVPIVGAETKYEAEDDKRIESTETHEYWLCVAYLEEDE